MKNRVEITTASGLASQDDGYLVGVCLEGNSAAWEALIIRYQRLIYSIPIKARLSHDDAADIFQAVCLKLYEKLSSLRDHEKISSWLITTTWRECWRLVAKNRREAARPGLSDDYNLDRIEEIPATGMLADEQRAEVERQQIVRQSIGMLPRAHPYGLLPEGRAELLRYSAQVEHAGLFHRPDSHPVPRKA